jgi:hypothetical protein
MKRNEGKYQVYSELPKDAVLVKDYAKSKGIGEPAIYNQYKRGTANFKIIIFFERNFIVPEKITESV